MIENVSYLIHIFILWVYSCHWTLLLWQLRQRICFCCRITVWSSV